jgi:hypothetical protein
VVAVAIRRDLVKDPQRACDCRNVAEALNRAEIADRLVLSPHCGDPLELGSASSMRIAALAEMYGITGSSPSHCTLPSNRQRRKEL